MSSSDIHRISLVGFVALSCLVTGALAEPITLQRGARVRVFVAEPSHRGSQGKRFTGKLLGLNDTSLILKTSHVGPPVLLARNDIARLEWSLSPSRHGRGALIGLGVGAVGGFMLGLTSGDDENCLICFTAEQKAGVLAVLLGLTGTLVGAAAAPGERWQALPLDDLHLSFDRTIRRGNGIAVTLRF